MFLVALDVVKCFLSQMSEKDQSEIRLYEISASVMGVLLDFCYTETVNVSVENVQELLPAACLLQLTGYHLFPPHLHFHSGNQILSFYGELCQCPQYSA